MIEVCWDKVQAYSFIQAKDIEISLNVNCISSKGHYGIKSQIK